MIKYMLDTNICIYLMNEQPEAVIARFRQCRKGEVAISSITWAELSCGLNIHNDDAQFEAILSAIKVMPFEIKAATIFGKLSQKFPNRKSSFDRMIAAHAISLGVVLVTNNVSDFELYGMAVENWVV
ncbi:MAG: type II toxin-antitoxin system VapC family toxin [Methylococcaceae bacterium]|nr:type II toxin-antitoxin system VapC family toxin [Methylococcaceae bacterium]